MKQFPRLFHKTSKGKINIWDIWSDGDTIFTRWGQKDGKQQDAKKKAKGKNAGKANATTDSEQAESEAQSMWTNKLERKYYQTEDEALNEVVFLPMLASKFSDRKRFLTEDSYPVFSQPKLDGVRCLAYWVGDKVRLMSRGGKDYVLPHISEALETVLEKNDVLDGELYIHGLPLQKLNSLVRGSHKHEDSVNVEYHLYDMIPNKDAEMPFTERLEHLNLFAANSPSDKICSVTTAMARDEDEVFVAHADFENRGYEGGIVRLGTGKYRFGYRSKELLKVKSFVDDEFEIFDFTNGIGKFENCIIYWCKTKEGEEFTVVPKGTFEQRAEWLAEGKEHIGKWLKVQYAGYSLENKPLFPVGLCIRLEEDM